MLRYRGASERHAVLVSDEIQPLPSLYARWMPQLLGGPIPRERQASCADCAMCRGNADEVAGATFFDPRTKCCTYVPDVPNFLAGAILLDADPDLAQGRSTVVHRIAQRVSVTPWGMDQSTAFKLLYGHETFGRSPGIRCPHYVADSGACGIWRHRPGVCATWFCKHERGEVGFEFWRRLARLLRVVETELAVWCTTQLLADSADLAAYLFDPPRPLRPADLGGPVDEIEYRRLWGRWMGREAEFYAQCAALIHALDWPAAVELCGPRVRFLASHVAAAYAQLSSQAVPARLRTGRLEMIGGGRGVYHVTSYSPNDPLKMSERLVRVLPHFDGRPTGEALDDIRVTHRTTLDATLLRKLVDFGILKESDHVEEDNGARRDQAGGRAGGAASR